MPKQKPPLKQSPIIRTLDQLLEDYDGDTLSRSLSSLNNDPGWQVIKAALMKEYLRTVAHQMDLASKTGTQIESAYYAGSAQTMFDVVNSLIPQYKMILEKKTGVIENARPEE